MAGVTHSEVSCSRSGVRPSPQPTGSRRPFSGSVRAYLLEGIIDAQLAPDVGNRVIGFVLCVRAFMSQVMEHLPNSLSNNRERWYQKVSLPRVSRFLRPLFCACFWC